MRLLPIAVALLAAALALSSCGGSSSKPVNTATYTCGQFQASLNSKSDTSAGNYINQLVKAAGLKGSTALQRRRIALGITFACGNKTAATRPKAAAVAIAKQIESGKFKPPSVAQKKKKSTK